jgi:hypothetical protein
MLNHRHLIVLLCGSAMTPGLVELQSTPVVSEARLQHLVGRWLVVESTFGNTDVGVPTTFVATSGVTGHAVFSVWTQGRGATYYEANALWAFSGASREVRVFEVTTLGAAETHVGGFDSTGVLRLELRDPANGVVREKRSFTWSGDTLRMSATFVTSRGETRHAVTLVRQP